MATEFVSNEIRDEAINALLQLPENKVRDTNSRFSEV